MHFIVDEQEVTKNIGRFKQKMAVSCLILMAAMFILVHLVALKGQLAHSGTLIIVKLRDKLVPEKLGKYAGEVEIIRSGVAYLMNSIQDINDSLKDYSVIAKEEFMCRSVVLKARLIFSVHGKAASLFCFRLFIFNCYKESNPTNISRILINIISRKTF